MITKDFLLYESGSGGELDVSNGDITLVEQLYQQVFLALFGGNIQASTLGNEPDTEVRGDWWGNSLIFADSPVQQFNSQTEKALLDNPLSSSGRVNIQRAVDNDLQYLKAFANISTNVVILSVNKVQIMVSISHPSNDSAVQYQYIFDNAKQELIINKVI